MDKYIDNIINHLIEMHKEKSIKDKDFTILTEDMFLLKSKLINISNIAKKSSNPYMEVKDKLDIVVSSLKDIIQEKHYDRCKY